MKFSHASAAILIAALAATGCQNSTASQTSVAGDIAAAYAKSGRFHAAAREIDLAVRARPRDLALRRQAAQIHFSAGNTDRAIGHLETATQFAPQDVGVWVDLGDIERNRENVSDAYVAYRRASELEPNDLRAVSGLALTAQDLGFDAEAEKALARWAELENAAGGESSPH